MDDAAMEAYLDGKEPDEATIIACLRKGTVSGKLVPVICGSAFKNKGVQPLLDAVVDFLPSPLEVPPTEGMMPGHRETWWCASPSDSGADVGPRVQDHERPVRRLAHLRAHLFGQDRERLLPAEHGQGPARADRPHPPDAREQSRGDQGGVRRRHRGAGRPEEHHHRRHAVRRRQARDPGADGVPGAGDRGRGRAALQARPGEDGHRPLAPGGRGSIVPGRQRSRVGPDRDQGDGRAPPRDHRRPHEARVQGRGQCRRAAGGLPRDHHPRSADRLHAQEAERRLGPVRPRQAGVRARARRARASSSRARSSAARCPRNTSRASRRA